MKESLEKKYQYLARMINRVVNKKKTERDCKDKRKKSNLKV